MSENTIKNIENFVDEVRDSGYKKVESFLTANECLDLERNINKAFRKAKENNYHTKNSYVKILSISQDDAENIKYFNFLETFLMTAQ